MSSDKPPPVLLGSDNVLTGLLSASLINCKDAISCPRASLPGRAGGRAAGHRRRRPRLSLVGIAMCDMSASTPVVFYLCALSPGPPASRLSPPLLFVTQSASSPPFRKGPWKGRPTDPPAELCGISGPLTFPDIIFHTNP